MSALDPTPDEFIWQLTVYREAMNQGLDGMEAVAWVIMNRLKSGKHGGSIMEVCTERLQFSSMTAEGNPMTIKWPTRMNLAEANAWRLAGMACEGVEDGTVADPTKGATYYYANTIAPPKWASAYTLTAQIGVHRFYRA